MAIYGIFVPSDPSQESVTVILYSMAYAKVPVVRCYLFFVALPFSNLLFNAITPHAVPATIGVEIIKR